MKRPKIRRGEGIARVEELRDKAINLHQKGELRQAKRAYQQVLRLRPDDFRANYLGGVLYGQLDESLKAIEALERALAVSPDHVPAMCEIAKQYQVAGRLEESAQMLRCVLEHCPDLGDVYSNLAILLKRMGRTEEAIGACRKAIDKEPECAAAHVNLGDLLVEVGDLEAAESAYRSVIRLQPSVEGNYQKLISLLRRQQRSADAARVLEDWLSVNPQNPVAQHLLSAITGHDTPTRASDRYVRSVFDKFAATFDQSLSQLDYHAPQLLGNAVKLELDTGEKLDVLDAGCGTGLCGPILRSLSNRLVGVDLSDQMLNKARARQLYDELVLDELTHYLDLHPGEFDMVVAADTFNYFGDLADLLAACQTALRDSGKLLFTLERHAKPDNGADYDLQEHGRYSHCADYVKRVVRENSFSINAIEEVVLRVDRDRPVQGFLVRAKVSQNQLT